MNVRIQPQMTRSQAHALEREIRRQCVEKTMRYEYLLDTVAVYVLHTQFGFGAERIKRFYDALFAERKSLQERYQLNPDDDMAEYVMFRRLKDAGIDFEAMFNEHNGEHRFGVRFSK